MRPAAGFTLLEIVFAIVLLAILTKVAMTKMVAPAALTLPAQAKSAAEQVRRAQTLAMTRRQRMSVGVTGGTNGRFTIGCAVTPPACPADPSFTLAMAQDVSVGTPSAAIVFNSLGQPVDSTGTPNAADITLTLGASDIATQTLHVAALTGRVWLTP